MSIHVANEYIYNDVASEKLMKIMPSLTMSNFRPLKRNARGHQLEPLRCLDSISKF